MKKEFVLLGLVLVVLTTFVSSAEPSVSFERQKAIAYANLVGWQLPHYEVGWRALEFKVRSMDKYHNEPSIAGLGEPCPYIRAATEFRPLAIYEGKWVRTSYSSKVCLIASGND